MTTNRAESSLGNGGDSDKGEGGIIGRQRGQHPHPLIYIGNGFIPGIPARDLTSDEVKKYGGVKFLLSLGLYAKPKKQKKKLEVKEGNNGRK